MLDGDDKGLMDAINAAIADETVEPEPEPEGENLGTEGPESEETNQNEPEGDDGNEPQADDPEGSEGDSGEAGEGAAGGDGDDPGEAEDEADAGEPSGEEGAGEPDSEPDPEPNPAPLDPVNDPIPSGVAQRTRERIETLIERVREGEQYRAERDEILGVIQSTGASPEEFNNTIQYMRLLHSPDPQAKRQAFQILQSELQSLAVEIGEANAPGVDFLQGHQDLQNAVAANEISEAHAREVALARMRQQRDIARQTEQAQQSQAQMSAQQAVQLGQQQLNDLEKRLGTDPQYEAKRDILVPMLKGTFQNIHPTQWAQVFENAYRNLNMPAPPVAPKPKPAPKNEPLRAKGPAGTDSRGINSPVEALDAALGTLGR